MSNNLQKDIPIFIQILDKVIEKNPDVLDTLISEDDMKRLILQAIDDLGIKKEDLKKEKENQKTTFIQVPPEINVSNMDNFIDLIKHALGSSDKKQNKETEPNTNDFGKTFDKNTQEKPKEEKDTEENKPNEVTEEETIEPNIIYPNRALNFIENTPKKAENGMYNPIYMFDDTVVTQYSMLIISYLNIKRKEAIQSLFKHIENETLSRFNMKLTIDSLNPHKFISAIEYSVFYPNKSYHDVPLNEAINEFLLENNYDVAVSEFMDFVKSKEDSYVNTSKVIPHSIQLSELAYLDLTRFDSILFS